MFEMETDQRKLCCTIQTSFGNLGLGIEAHAFNPNSWEAEAGISEFRASLST